VLHVRADLEADLAEALKAPEIAERDDALALRVALLMGRGYCLLAQQEWQHRREGVADGRQAAAARRLTGILGP